MKSVHLERHDQIEFVIRNPPKDHETAAYLIANVIDIDLLKGTAMLAIEFDLDLLDELELKLVKRYD